MPDASDQNLASRLPKAERSASARPYQTPIYKPTLCPTPNRMPVRSDFSHRSRYNAHEAPPVVHGSHSSRCVESSSPVPRVSHRPQSVAPRHFRSHNSQPKHISLTYPRPDGTDLLLLTVVGLANSASLLSHQSRTR